MHIELNYRLSKRVIYKTRSPTPEEVQHLVDLADLRGRVIVSLLALGGFRVGTLSQLRYYHVKHDLERGIIPINIHVESAITKGKYGDYDTFLGPEAIEYLKLYLDSRRIGTLSRTGGRIHPASITDDSPLIRDSHAQDVRPITPARIHDIVHSPYRKAGLVSRRTGRRYELTAHSLRKYFRTQLASLGVNTDYIDYMMGHILDTYHDIQMKGTEYLRDIYTASGLSIRPKTQLTKLELLKKVARAWGINSEQILTREATTIPHRSYATASSIPERQVELLTHALKEAVKQELQNTV